MLAQLSREQITQIVQLPHFLSIANTLLRVIGLMRGPDTSRPTPAEDWSDATVDVVIPAFNDQDNIVRCLESVLRQTRRPRRIVVVDDGGSDATARRAREFGDFFGVDLLVIQRFASIGKTPTLRDQASGLDSDVLFVLDADTILESDTYLERTVQELERAVGIASACGIVRPLRERDRSAADRSPIVRLFADGSSSYSPAEPEARLRRLASGVTNTYRAVLYLLLQRVVHRGEMAVCGTVYNPVSCAVAYRRTYLKAIFDTVGPVLGNDLNAEDIFVGLAMLTEGYRNVQVPDVYARTGQGCSSLIWPKRFSLPFSTSSTLSDL